MPRNTRQNFTAPDIFPFQNQPGRVRFQNQANMNEDNAAPPGGPGGAPPGGPGGAGVGQAPVAPVVPQPVV